MKTKILFLIATLLSSQNVLANDDVTIIEKKEAIYKDSSEYGRMGKRFSVQYQVGVTAGVGANSLVAAYFLDRNLLLQAEITGSNGEGKKTSWGLSAGSWGSQAEEIEGIDSYGLHVKKFFGNSFYINGDWTGCKETTATVIQARQESLITPLEHLKLKASMLHLL